MVQKVITSRLFVLAVVFCLMSSALVMRLFNLQIIKGEEYQDAYTAMTEKVIKTASTRGNIYDRNGNVLAYNELAYDVTIQDTGAYKTDAQWNTMLYDLVSILNKHGERTDQFRAYARSRWKCRVYLRDTVRTQAIPA